MPNVAVSIVVTTYNSVKKLELVLLSLNDNTCDFQVVVADDGSTDETRQLLSKIKHKLKFEIVHVWQADLGFRAARARNLAVLQATGDYLIFLDGDCVVPRNFVKHHVMLAEAGWFVVGNRVLLSKELTEQLESTTELISQCNLLEIISYRCKKKLNKIGSLFLIPLGPLRKLYKHKWNKAKSCNLAVWKSDFYKVNGFDEQFVGWGFEDSDFVIRMLRLGVSRKSGRYATPVFHHWHAFVDRSSEQNNKEKLQQVLSADYTQARQGIEQLKVTHSEEVVCQP